jgi:CheY-like chemotaxis protein
MVLGLGYSVVGVTQTLDGALKAISELNFDVALLDINLGGRRTPETADLLLEQGIPFAFVSGYEHVADPQYAHVPMVLKPFSDAQIGAVLTTLVGPGEVQNMIAVGTVSSTPPSL